ncbi:MAG: hypothetical protein ACK56F_01475, partial [bacterium]
AIGRRAAGDFARVEHVVAFAVVARQLAVVADAVVVAVTEVAGRTGQGSHLQADHADAALERRQGVAQEAVHDHLAAAGAHDVRLAAARLGGAPADRAAVPDVPADVDQGHRGRGR